MYAWTLKKLRRVIVAVIGVTVLLVGIAMIVLPGPAVIVIPAGLAILATEFVWARRLLHKVRERLQNGLANRNNKRAGYGKCDGQEGRSV